MFGIMIEIGDFKSVTLSRSPMLFLSSRLETPVVTLDPVESQE